MNYVHDRGKTPPKIPQQSTLMVQNSKDINFTVIFATSLIWVSFLWEMYFLYGGMNLLVNHEHQTLFEFISLMLRLLS